MDDTVNGTLIHPGDGESGTGGSPQGVVSTPGRVGVFKDLEVSSAQVLTHPAEDKLTPKPYTLSACNVPCPPPSPPQGAAPATACIAPPKAKAETRNWNLIPVA